MDLLDEAALRARELDMCDVRQTLLVPDGTYKWQRFRVNEVELEWRRWRIRHYLGADDDPPASIKLFERLGVASGIAPALPGPSGWAAPSVLQALSYDEMFPQGPVVAKAAKARVIRASDPSHPERMAASTRRRDAYLSKLDSDSYWWMIPDFISAATRVACIKDAAALHPGDGAAYDGGPDPGWDIEHDALVSKSCNAYLGAGPALIAIHEDPALVALISERMGRLMYPTRCTYLRYRVGDYLGVHTDQPTCEVSLLFTVDGEAGPMRSYFDQAGTDPSSLNRWVTEYGQFPEGGRDFIYQPREALALTGRAVPHARLPQFDSAVIGALFYSGLT